MAQLYFYVSDLGLTTAQRGTLLGQLRLLELNHDAPNPCDRNHRRENLAGDTCIYEADLNPDHLSALAIKARLVALFGVAANTVTYATTQTAFGPAVLYKYNSVNKLRLGVFGGIDADWGTSLEAGRAFLKANAAQWEPANA